MNKTIAKDEKANKKPQKTKPTEIKREHNKIFLFLLQLFGVIVSSPIFALFAFASLGQLRGMEFIKRLGLLIIWAILFGRYS